MWCQTWRLFCLGLNVLNAGVWEEKNEWVRNNLIIKQTSKHKHIIWTSHNGKMQNDFSSAQICFSHLLIFFRLICNMWCFRTKPLMSGNKTWFLGWLEVHSNTPFLFPWGVSRFPSVMLFFLLICMICFRIKPPRIGNKSWFLLIEFEFNSKDKSFMWIFISFSPGEWAEYIEEPFVYGQQPAFLPTGAAAHCQAVLVLTAAAARPARQLRRRQNAARGEQDMMAVGHDGIMSGKHVMHYWPFVRGIHQSMVDSHHKGPV